MKAPHLLRVDEGPEHFAELIAAARAEKLRVGWLELAAVGETPAAEEAQAVTEAPAATGAPATGEPEATEQPARGAVTPQRSGAGSLPASLGEAAAAGCLRAVAAGGGRTVAVKPVAGPLVLRDLLREHFLGCRLVLIRGPVDAPLLAPAGGGAWGVTTAAGAVHSYTMDELAAALRKPRPWE